MTLALRLHRRTPGRALAAALALAGLLPTPAAGDASPADRAIAAAGRNTDERRPEGWVALATAFMRKARESGDPAYYDRASAALDRAFAIAPEDDDALRTRAWVLLGRHEFRAAVAAAEEARARDPEDWRSYAHLTDARIEVGDYAGAEDAAQRLLDLRPGLPAYTRAAFLRTLFGDRPGAVDLLLRAVRVASPRDPEALAWTLVHLGHEYFAAGDLASAARAYAHALEVLPGYYMALGALARVEAARGRTGEAIELYRRAVAEVPAPDLVAALGDVYAVAGDVDEAERQYTLVEFMGRVAEAAGTTYGRQLALFYADHDRRLPDALRLARDEASARGDIYTDDALAWALHKNGRPEHAMRAAHRALRLGTEDALLHYHAGMISLAAGRPRAAARRLAHALELNPYFDLRQADVARTTVARIADR